MSHDALHQRWVPTISSASSGGACCTAGSSIALSDYCTVKPLTKKPCVLNTCKTWMLGTVQIHQIPITLILLQSHGFILSKFFKTPCWVGVHPVCSILALHSVTIDVHMERENNKPNNQINEEACFRVITLSLSGTTRGLSFTFHWLHASDAGWSTYLIGKNVSGLDETIFPRNNDKSRIYLLHVSVYLSIYLSVYLSIYLSVYLSIYPSIHRSIYLSIYLPICLSVCLPVCLSVCQSTYQYVRLSLSGSKNENMHIHNYIK